MPDDLADLVAAARDGDRAAFEQLVRATSPETYTLAYRLVGNQEDARDVVQETYLRAYKGIGRFRGDAQFSTWLYRITANCAATHLGRRAKHRHDELLDDAPLADLSPDRDPQERAVAEQLRGELSVALDALPPKLRSVIVLRDVYDLSHEAIAEELGISESAAKVRLHRARRQLRERLFPLPGDRDVHGGASRAV
jgi:RNA polymerase sigma-70 factor (ECF subfamily)